MSRVDSVSRCANVSPEKVRCNRVIFRDGVGSSQRHCKNSMNSGNGMLADSSAGTLESEQTRGTVMGRVHSGTEAAAAD